MKVLSLDTSSKECSVALLEDTNVIDKMHNTSEREHSQTLMPMIKKILEKNNISLNDINLLACGKGPGSFTGVRIGIATVKAFADVKNIPMAGVDSLEALAYSVLIKKGKQNCKILSMIDAKNENVYFAVYRFHNGNLSIYKNSEVLNISNTVNYINLLEPLYIVGDAKLEKIEPLIRAISAREQAEGKDVKSHEYVKDIPTMAEAVGIAAVEKYRLGTITDTTTIIPKYLRKPLAERQKEGKHIESYEISILEMTKSDAEKMKSEYEKFSNLWNYQTFAEDFKNSKYIVAKYNDEIIGFLGYRIVFDELEIMNIVTRNDKRKVGIASNLLSYIIRKTNVEKINLEVNENNIAAINMYKKFGFRQVGIRKNYYDGQDNAILMSI